MEQSRRRQAHKVGTAVGNVSYTHILARDGYHCYICDKPIDPTLKKCDGALSFDHRIPLRPRPGNPKGTHTEENIHPTHLVCNFRKNNRRLEDMTPFDRRGPDC
ncbi:MAG TPA: HNH endonuclease [Ktedonobacteraceae bacterium]|nr:HNH endonuclease [Ktedonobacteraceae bacterium]